MPVACAASESACSWSSRPRAAAPASSSRIVSSARSTIAWSRSRRTTGTREPAQEKRRELRGHQPGARDPDLRHGARLGGRATGTAPGAPLDEVERVERGLRLRREEQVGERLLLGPVALLDAPRLGAFDQVERPVGRRRRAVQGVVELAAGARDELARRGEIGGVAGRLLERDRDRLVDQPLQLDHAIDEAELVRLLRAQHLVLAHRVRDHQLHGRLGPDQPRRELRRAPGGDEAEQAFGRRDVADLVGDHAVVAVQRELDASAEDGAVDRGDGRVRKLADAREEVVSRAAALDRLLARSR